MTWILTTSGRRLDLAAPQQGDIAPMDIAWALAQTNRFTGHCLRPYSVAEHCLLVAHLAEHVHRLDVHGLLAALMHDAHEAYCGDLSSPAKQALGEPWRQFESRVEHTVRTAFALHTASAMHRDAIKHCDLMALATERRDLMPSHGAGAEPWPCLAGIEPAHWVNLRSNERTAMGWEDWRDRWLDKYHELDYERNEALFSEARARAVPTMPVTPAVEAEVARLFPSATNDELAQAFGLTVRQVQHIGTRHGLTKSAEAVSRARRARGPAKPGGPLTTRIAAALVAAGDNGLSPRELYAAFPAASAEQVDNAISRLRSTKRAFRAGPKLAGRWFATRDAAAACEARLTPRAPLAGVTVATTRGPAHEPAPAHIPEGLTVQYGAPVPGPWAHVHANAPRVFGAPGQYDDPAPRPWVAAATARRQA